MKHSKDLEKKIKYFVKTLSSYCPITEKHAIDLYSIEGLYEFMNDDSKLKTKDGSKRVNFDDVKMPPNIDYKRAMVKYINQWFPLPEKTVTRFTWPSYEALANFLEFKSGMIDKDRIEKRFVKYNDYSKRR